MRRRRVAVFSCTGSPEGQCVGNVGDICFRVDGSGTTSRYVKASGQGSATGWVEAGEAPGGSGTPGDTVSSEASYGLSSSAGVATAYSRADHTHGTPSLGTTGTTACAGNDSRLSDARTPLAHTHTLADITDEGALAALNTVNTAQIDNGAVTPAKTSFSPAAPDVGKFLKATGVGTVAYDAPTASVAISAATIAFTDGDTARRVTITDVSVSATSKVLCSVRRPDTTDDSADRGYLYIPNVVKCASGSFDVLVCCLDIGGMDPTMKPPNETITLLYQVA